MDIKFTHIIEYSINIKKQKKCNSGIISKDYVTPHSIIFTNVELFTLDI